MKLAIVHDDFIQHGGAENLVLALCEIWPDAVLYSSYATKEWEAELKLSNIKLVTSFMQHLPFKKKLNKFYAGLFLFPLAFESFKFDEFDVVLSVSARFSHCIVTKPQTKHIAYINSPGRMFWEALDYFEDTKFAKSRFLNKVASRYLKTISAYYRVWDFTAAQRVDAIIANSKTPKARILTYYKRESEIIYPFVDVTYFENTKKTKGNFYLVISRLASWKRIDTAVRACIKTGDNLVVVGDGEMLAELKRLSAGHKNIQILGRVPESRKLELLCSCKALINTQYEDFGIVPLEAMACGKPVLAYGRGGVLETVLPGKTGDFYYEQTPEALILALSSFHPEKYLMTDCIFQARRFSKELFKNAIANFVNSVYLGN